jgi:hypothetical protein
VFRLGVSGFGHVEHLAWSDDVDLVGFCLAQLTSRREPVTRLDWEMISEHVSLRVTALQ